MHEARRFLSIPLLSLSISMSAAVWGGETIKASYKDGVTLAITIDPFDAKAHATKKCGDYVCLIDGKPFYGSDGAVPKYAVSRLVFEKNGKQTALDVSSMYDPWIDSESMKRSFSVDSSEYSGGGSFSRITGYFSDGAGAYVCQWLVIMDGAIRNHISNSEELGELTSQLNNK